MNLGRWARGLLALTLVVLAACGGGDAPASIVAMTVGDFGPIFRRASITLSRPAEVEIEYWAASGPRLRVAGSRAATHELALPRLRERQTYRYRVRTIDEHQRSAWSGEASFGTGDLPDDLRTITFTASGQASFPLTFLSLRSAFNGGVIVDAQGHVVWYARTAAPPLGATRRANGHWVILQGGAGLTEFSPLGQTVAQLGQQQVPGGEAIHHDLAATPWNTILFLAFEPRESGGRTIQGEALWDWDPASGALRKRWSAWDFLDPALDAGARSVPDDWWHANSVAFGTRGNVLVSLHYLDQVISLAPDFGSIEWRLGGPGGTLAVAPDQVTSGQHSVREVAPNRILLFDNGFARADGAQSSRALELALDPSRGTVQTAWEYRPEPVIWARIMSSARRLPNGHSVVTFGIPAGTLGSSGPVEMHEVSPSGQRVWALTLDMAQGAVFQGDALESIGGEIAVP